MNKKSRKLQPTSPLMLTAVAGVSGVTVGVLVFAAVRAGWPAVPIPAGAALVPLMIGVVVLWLAGGVRGYQRRERAMNQIAAARIWVLAQASSRAGAILAGAGAGIAVGYALSGATSFLLDNALNAGIAALGALAMTIMALVGERWCEWRPPDAEGASSSGRREAPPLG